MPCTPSAGDGWIPAVGKIRRYRTIPAFDPSRVLLPSGSRKLILWSNTLARAETDVRHRILCLRKLFFRFSLELSECETFNRRIFPLKGMLTESKTKFVEMTIKSIVSSCRARLSTHSDKLPQRLRDDHQRMSSCGVCTSVHQQTFEQQQRRTRLQLRPLRSRTAVSAAAYRPTSRCFRGWW